MAASAHRPSSRRRSAVLLHTSAAAALLVAPAAAQIAPGGANAPKMDVAANGTPIVTINTPNARGVSNNTYRDFNVDARGLILNNSGKIVSTNLAGYIGGNAGLKTSGPAGLILNQVVSASPSVLGGYMEVAGSPAQVVVANPNGITCNGCGFINTPWATLTTGTPRFGADGAVIGYSVDRGAISVGGAGLDASGMRLDLFARAVAVNANIHADVLDASFGAAEVGAGDEIVVTARRSDEAAPRFGLDVAALGGMYAKSIRLIGTEAGLGVRVDGTLASLERGFTLNAAGDIQLAGRAIGATTAAVATAGALDVAGTLYADAGVRVAAGATSVGGLVASGTDLRLDVGGLQSTGVLAAGLARDGALGTAGAIGIASPGAVALGGRTVTPGALTVDAGTIDLSRGLAQAGTAALKAGALTNRAGRLGASGSLGIAVGSLSNAGVLQGGAATIATGTANNDGGTIVADGALSLAATGDLSNANGTIQSGGALTLSAASIGNAGGSIVNLSNAATAVTARGGLAGANGTIGGNGDVAIDAGSIAVGGADGRLIAGGRLAATARAGSIDAAGAVISSGGDMALTATGAIDARGGAISSGGVAALKASSLTLDDGALVASAFAFDVPAISLRRGRIDQTGTADFAIASSGTLDYSGARILSNGTNFTLDAGRLVNGGGEILHGGAGLLSVSVADALNNRGGRIATNGGLRLTAGSIDGAGGAISAVGDAAVTSRAAFGNDDGTLAAGGKLDLAAGAVANARGSIGAGGALNANVASIVGDGGRVAATGAGALTLTSAGAASARGGVIGGNGDVSLRAATLDVGGGGRLVAGGTLGVVAGSVRADGGEIAGDALDLRVAGVLDATGGAIRSATVGAVAADRLVTDGGSLAADVLDVRVGELSNLGGDIAASGAVASRIATTRAIANADGAIATRGALNVEAGAIGNAGGRILVAGDAGLRVAVGGAVASRGGVIGGNGAVSFAAGSLDIGEGQLSAGGALDAAVAGDLRADDAAIVSGGPLKMTVGGAADARGGAIETAGLATIAAGSLNLDRATLTADGLALRAGDLSVREGGRVAQTGAGALAIDVARVLDVSGGSIEANGSTARIAAGTLNNVGGRILSQSTGSLAIEAGRLVNAGRVAGNGTLGVTAGSLTNTGSIGALGDARFAVANALNNRAGTLASGGALSAAAGSLTNTDGVVSGAAGLSLSGGSVDNDGGRLVAGRFGEAGDAAKLTIAVAGDLASRGGLIAATGAADVRARSIDVGAAGRLTGAGVSAAATGGNLSLRGGTVDGPSVSLSASGTVDASADGLIQGERVAVRGGALDVSGGRLFAGALDVGVGSLRNRGGAIAATGAAPLTIAVAGLLDNGAGGTISTNADALTLRAGALDNAGGTIAHAGAGTLTIASGSLLDNRGGSIATNGGYAVAATDFANGGGTLSAPGAGSLALSGALGNARGLVAAGRDLTVSAGAIDNDGGALQAGAGLTLDAGSLLDRGGRAVGDAAATLRIAGVLDNGAAGGATGVIGSRGGLSLAAGSLLNRGGTVTGADAVLNLGALTNGGEISAANALALTVRGAADNAGGAMAATDLTLNAGSFANNGGSVTAARGLTLDVAGLLDNAAGVLGGPGAATLRAGSLANGGTISGGTLTIAAADRLANAAGGAIYASGDGSVSATTLANAGSIGAGGALTIAAADLDNGAGAIGADGLLRLKVGTARFGRLGIAQDFALDLAGDSTVAAGETIEAPRDLFLNVGGTLTNGGTIKANRALALNAGGDVVNGTDGVITAADLSVTAGGAVTNAGLINGARTFVGGASLVNTRSIFGDALTISVRGDVSNSGSGAAVATREGTLAILTPGRIANADGATIFSLGDLLIAGADGQGRAASLVNSSASIEVQGDASVAADEIVNKRTLFTFADVALPQTEVKRLRIFPPRRGYDRTFLEYKENITETRITGDSGEALLLVGGDLGVSTAALTNAYSTVSAGGNLTVNGSDGTSSGVVSNLSLVGKRVTDRVGEYDSYKDGIIGDVHKDSDYVFHLEEDTFVVGSVIAAGGALTIDGAAISNLTLDANGDEVGDLARAAGVGRRSLLGDGAALASPAAAAGGAAIGGAGAGVTLAAATFAADGATPLNVSAEIGGNAVLARLAGDAVGRVAATGTAGAVPTIAARFAGSATPAFSITVGGLFQFAAANGRFLVESNPAFTDGRNFISSDYFLDRLGYDPARVGKRLGDALYEQQLVGRQLAGLTGTTRLAAYADNDAQYRALMDAGVTVARRLQLAPGVALTPEQAATLTSDIVLMVNVTVDTPSGPQQALAPVVYLAKVRPGDVRGSGALIAGDAIVLRSADALTNSGVIRASAGTRIEVATLNNAGAIETGRVGAISTSGDLTSRGGAIRGGDLSLTAGGNIDLGAAATTTRFATSTPVSTARGTTLSNRVSLVDASGDLRVVAAGDLASRGAQLSAGGSATLLTGGSADLGVAVDRVDGVTRTLIKNGRRTETASDETVVGTSIAAGDRITVATGLIDPAGTLALNGGTIASANGPVSLSGAGGVSIGAANESDRFVTETRTKKSGLLSSTKTTTRDTLTADTAVGSTVSGSSVGIDSANGGISVLGSNVVADGDVSLSAAGPVTIGAAETRTLEESSRSVKKSGVSVSIGGGGINAFAGVAKNSQASTSATVSNVGSLVGSTGGDVTIASGGEARVMGSRIATPGDVRIAANSILVENALDTNVSTNRAKSSSVGLSVNIGSPAIAGAATAVRMADTAARTTEARTAGVAAVAGGLAVKNTADTLANPDAPIASASASLGISRSRSQGESRTETAVGSVIQGRDVTLIANGAGAAGTIGVRGSDVLASRDLSLAANGAIDGRGAAQTSTASGSSRSSGASIGVGAQIGRNGAVRGPSLDIGVSGARGSSSSAETTWRETNLAAGGTATVGTPGALTLDAATLSGRRVEVDAGSLDVTSRQDSATYRSRNSSAGASVSIGLAGDVSVAANAGRAKMGGDYLSVVEQSGVYAGDGGFGIKVAGNTNLTGGAIASTADSALNRLETGTLTVSDLRNRERYGASSVNVGFGLGAVGRTDRGEAASGGDRTAGSRLPGISTPLGNLTATPPVALGASGRQAGVTSSAISPGAIVVTTDDAASRTAAARVSRDASGANAGALTREFDDTRRAEIGLGFDATRQLTAEVGTFFANRAAEEAAKRRAADAAEARGDAGAAARLRTEADGIRNTYGAGSAARIVATAVTGAAGSNVAGGVGNLVQGAAVNVLQSLAATQVKSIADSLGDFRGDATASSEGVRAALQAVVGCAGAAAGGSGGCGSAATGAAAGVVVNYLLTSYVDPALTDGARTLEDQEARKNLVTTIIAGIAVGAGLDAPAATAAAQIETENNDLTYVVKEGLTLEEARRSLAAAEKQIAEKPGDSKDSAKAAPALRAYIAQLERGEIIATATSKEIAFAGGAAELDAYLAAGGSLSGLREERAKQSYAAAGDVIANAALTDEARVRLRARLDAGVSPSQVIMDAFSEATGVDLTVADFANRYDTELRVLDAATGLMPGSRAAGVVTDVGLNAYEASTTTRVEAFVEVLKQADTRATGAGRQALSTSLMVNPRVAGTSAATVRLADLPDGRLGHIIANHGPGSGKPGKTEFPNSWDVAKIAREVSSIATDASLVEQTDSRGTPFVVGVRDGIEIRVNFYPAGNKRDGTIATAYPLNVPVNPRR